MNKMISTLAPSRALALLLPVVILILRQDHVTGFVSQQPSIVIRPIIDPLRPGGGGEEGITALHASAVANPFKKLPWNVQKEREREARRLKHERAKLHRELGIAEDATYEEIVEATERLIAMAGSDLKQKIRVEVAKDKILQIRLNERLAGLAQATKDARAQSSYEAEGVDDDDVPKTSKELSAPSWTKGLIVKPDKAYVTRQVKIWGVISLVGAAFPPAMEYLKRFTWLICMAQLTFRGVSKDQMEAGGFELRAELGKSKGHKRLAALIAFSTWIIGSLFIYSLMPAWAKSQRWGDFFAFLVMNVIYGTVSCYLQPYRVK